MEFPYCFTDNYMSLSQGFSSVSGMEFSTVPHPVPDIDGSWRAGTGAVAGGARSRVGSPHVSGVFAADRRGMCRGAVWVNEVDAAGLSDSQLDGRLAELGRARSQLDGLFAQAAAEKERRVGGKAAAAALREHLRLSARQAGNDVNLAAALAQRFPATLEALCSGEITAAHARVIARVGSDPGHEDEPELLEMARGAPADLFARMTRHYERRDDDASKLQRQRDERFASMVQDPDGSWRLNARFDYSRGKRISLLFERMVKTMRRGEPSHSDRTGPQRRADALYQLITGDGPEHRGSVSLLVIADYDAVRRHLTDLRLDDGLPMPADELARIGARMEVLPAFFDAEGQPLWLGRSDRIASEAQRTVLAARDGGCIGCAAPAERCDAHHIKWWSNGGLTDISNLCLLCARCHHLIHDQHWQVHRYRSSFHVRPPPTHQPAHRPDATEG